MTRTLSRPAALLTLVVALAATLLSACGADDGPAKGRTPQQALAAAQHRLDKTSGIEFKIASDDLPEGITTLKSASGTLTHQPGFKGVIIVPVLGTDAQIPVTAVDGKVFAKLPFTSSYQQVDPAEYGVPDPATLLAPGTGISSLLSATTGVKLGKAVRGGADNKDILSTYTGSLPGTTVAKLLHNATGDFRATYVIDSSGELSEASITGHFNGADTDPSTYTVSISSYDVTTKIAAP